MKSFVQYGAGNIGRGFIGQIFSEAGYHIHFIDIDLDIIERLNSENRYPINIVSNIGSKIVWVENVDCINALHINEVADAISTCDLMATAVGVNILPRIAANIVAGFRKRIEIGNRTPLNIIICENLIDADKLLYKLVTDLLSNSEMELFNDCVGLVEASVGRMVPVMTEEQRKDNPLSVYVESYFELPIDKDAFKGKIPIVPHLLPFTPFEFCIMQKLFIHNMGHAMAAYLGNLLNYEYIWQAAENPEIKFITRKAMFESATALSKKFNIPHESISEHVDDLLLRFGNKALGDTIQRVGRDTGRKLSANDRFAGAIRLCEEVGIISLFIPVGIAAGLLFHGVDDESDILNMKIEEEGLDSVLTEVCKLDVENDYIKSLYFQLKENANLKETIDHITQIKSSL
jgi:mannitol-1-phosphate 5-dehydrogenase